MRCSEHYPHVKWHPWLLTATLRGEHQHHLHCAHQKRLVLLGVLLQQVEERVLGPWHQLQSCILISHGFLSLFSSCPLPLPSSLCPSLPNSTVSLATSLGNLFEPLKPKQTFTEFHLMILIGSSENSRCSTVGLCGFWCLWDILHSAQDHTG